MQQDIDNVAKIELGQVWVRKYPETRMLIGSNPIFERKRLVFKGYTLNSDNIIVESGFYDLTNFLKSFTYTNKMIKPGQVYQGLRKSGYVHYLVDSINGTEVWMRVITNGKPNRTRHRWSCSGLLNNDPIAVSLEEYNEKFIPQSDKNPVTESSSLPSYYEKFEEKIDSLTAKFNLISDVIVMAKIRECLAVPSEFGHSDIGDFLFAYLKGKYTLEEFLWTCDVTFLGSNRERPT